MISLTGIAVIATVLSVMLKKYNPEYSMVIGLMAGIYIIGVILSKVHPAISQINSLISATKIQPQYAIILFKSLGICFITQFASDACKDAGEVGLSGKIELAGKVSIVLICLPLFEEVINTVLKLIGG